MVSRGLLGVLVGSIALTGCTAWQTAVIGTSPSYPLAMWRGRDVVGVEEREDGQLVPLTWSRAIGVGLDPTWALVDFHDVPDARAGSSLVVVEGLHRVDGTPRFPALAGLIERVLARHELWVASHQSETDEVLAQFPDATRSAAAPRITAAAWSVDRLALTVTTTLAATAMAMPCGGAPHPPRETTLGGMEWSRDYEVTDDGTVTPTSDGGGRVLPGPPSCDPRVP